MRLDKFLWFARFAKTRALAQAIAEAGHLRIDGRTVDRAHCAVQVGNVLSFPQGPHVRVVRIEALPPRRGPPAEARLCYSEVGVAAGAANVSQQPPLH